MRALTVAAVITLAMLASGCAMLAPQESPLVQGSQWRVVALDGEATAGLELILTFIGDTATLSSACGAGSADVAMADDGRDLAFGEFDGPGGRPICPDQALALHQRVADALGTVERWEAAGQTITLTGEQAIRIQPQRTDT